MEAAAGMVDRKRRRHRQRIPLPLLGAAAAAVAHTGHRSTAAKLARSAGSPAYALSRPARPCTPPLLAAAPPAGSQGLSGSLSGGPAWRLGRRARGRRRQGKALPEALSFFSVVIGQAPERIAHLGPLGPLYFFGVYVAAELVAIPATPMTLTAGYLFGMPLGAVITLLAGSTSACIGFGLSRTFLQPHIARLAAQNSVYQKINKAVEREGFKIIFLLRVSPLVPFSVTNYCLGLSSVSFMDYLGATALAFVPSTLTYVYLAATARSVLAVGGCAPWYVYALGAAATLVLLRQAGEVAKRAVDEAVVAKTPSSKPAEAGA